MGVDNFVRAFQLSDGTLINCFIYDTCGQERYHSINESYYKKAGAILLVYDISNKKSFEILSTYYVNKIKENCKKGIPILLLGNKADLEEERQVSKEEGIKLACKHNFEFKETSCLQNKNVAGAFEALAESWNFQMHTKNKNKTDSKIQLFKKSFTEYNLGNSKKNNIKKEVGRASSFNVVNYEDKIIVLEAGNIKVKKKHHCCISKSKEH